MTTSTTISPGGGGQGQGQGRPSRLGVVGTVLGTLISGILAWFSLSTLQEGLCVQWKTSGVFQATGVCPEQFRRVDTIKVAEAVDSYLANLHPRPNDQTSWALLVPARQQELGAAALAQQYKDVAWAERVAPVAAGGQFNSFAVTYRVYGDPVKPDGEVDWSSRRGRVDEYRQQLTVKYIDGKVRLDWGEKIKTPNFGQIYQRNWAEFLHHGQTYRHIDRLDEVQASSNNKGGGYAVLCEKAAPGGETWYRTYVGWARSRDVKVADRVANIECVSS